MNFLAKIYERTSQIALRKLESDHNYKFIRDTYLFQDLSPEALYFVLSRLIERRYTSDELIFKQDNPSVCLFIVKRGGVEVYFSRGDDDKVIFQTVAACELFGEISVISSTYRTATAKALENDTVLLTLSSFDLDELSQLYPQDGLKVLRGITDTIISYLANTTKKLRSATIDVQTLMDKLADYERG